MRRHENMFDIFGFGGGKLGRRQSLRWIILDCHITHLDFGAALDGLFEGARHRLT